MTNQWNQVGSHEQRIVVKNDGHATRTVCIEPSGEEYWIAPGLSLSVTFEKVQSGDVEREDDEFETVIYGPPGSTARVVMNDRELEGPPEPSVGDIVSNQIQMCSEIPDISSLVDKVVARIHSAEWNIGRLPASPQNQAMVCQVAADVTFGLGSELQPSTEVYRLLTSICVRLLGLRSILLRVTSDLGSQLSAAARADLDAGDSRSTSVLRLIMSHCHLTPEIRSLLVGQSAPAPREDHAEQ